MIELHEADVFFEQFAGHEAVRSIGTIIATIRSVQIEDLIRLLRCIKYAWYGRLHTEGQFVLCDAGIHFRVAPGLVLDFIEFFQVVKHLLPISPFVSIRILQEEDRVGA